MHTIRDLQPCLLRSLTTTTTTTTTTTMPRPVRTESKAQRLQTAPAFRKKAAAAAAAAENKPKPKLPEDVLFLRVKKRNDRYQQRKAEGKTPSIPLSRDGIAKLLRTQLPKDQFTIGEDAAEMFAQFIEYVIEQELIVPASERQLDGRFHPLDKEKREQFRFTHQLMPRSVFGQALALLRSQHDPQAVDAFLAHMRSFDELDMASMTPEKRAKLEQLKQESDARQARYKELELLQGNYAKLNSEQRQRLVELAEEFIPLTDKRIEEYEKRIAKAAEEIKQNRATQLEKAKEAADTTEKKRLRQERDKAVEAYEPVNKKWTEIKKALKAEGGMEKASAEVKKAAEKAHTLFQQASACKSSCTAAYNKEVKKLDRLRRIVVPLLDDAHITLKAKYEAAKESLEKAKTKRSFLERCRHKPRAKRVEQEAAEEGEGEEEEAEPEQAEEEDGPQPMDEGEE